MGSDVPDAGVPLTTFGSGEALSNARFTAGGVVRDGGSWSPTVVALLAHFERFGFAGAPRIVGTGIDAEGRETITYLPGGSPHPRAWSDDAAYRLGEVLRAAHEAARTFNAPFRPLWQPWFGRDLPGDLPVIGHCDVGPWNWVAAADGLPYALLDWEFAGPVDALWEVAHAAWLNAQLHDDDIAEFHSLPDALGRARQARLILDGYGLSASRRVGMVNRMIELAIHSARAEAVTYSVSASSPEAHNTNGYPVLWAVTWRARSASWMLRNRARLESSIE
ncbi:MAG: aminoglycoside phosphotransferase family protein [Actinomycetota bacterium]|nr:aminoglycoside phosphotransferase family protein [Actinomycetota bacterium]